MSGSQVQTLKEPLTGALFIQTFCGHIARMASRKISI